MKNHLLLQEVRGVMTRFDPLTEQIVSERTEDGLTYTELSETLSAFDLDIRKAVHDPTRRIFHTYYADYECGLYAELILNRQYIHDTGQRVLCALTRQGGTCSELIEKDWASYYAKSVPLPMLIWDFQQRYRDIPKEKLFSIWYRIYKRIDYSNDMWRAEVLKYIFQYAPPSTKPPADPDGLITIYRGMGERSLPPERAISWSSHPGNALWFAIHCGRGTHIAVARVRPEQIVAYFPTFADENEVIILPGSITDYHYENMIPAIQKTVPPLLASSLLEFQYYGRQAKMLGYPEDHPFAIHGVNHILRVLLLTLLYYHNSGDDLSEVDRSILIYFSLMHDIGRMNDELDDAHGERSVTMIRSKGLRLHGIRLTRKEYRIANLLITYHSHDDAAGEAAIMTEPNLSRREKKHIVHLYHICKDMDGLDRVRFNGLDYRMLRTEYGRQLPLIAGCLLEEDLLGALEINCQDGENKNRHS